jgi:hypothetical protein
MQLQAGQTVSLFDGQQHRLGEVVVEKIEDGLVLGTFAAGQDFAKVEPLFAEFVEAANQQLFHCLDKLDAAITALGLYLVATNGIPLPAIEDVQIADRHISLRIRVPDARQNSSLPPASRLEEDGGFLSRGAPRPSAVREGE